MTVSHPSITSSSRTATHRVWITLAVLGILCACQSEQSEPAPVSATSGSNSPVTAESKPDAAVQFEPARKPVDVFWDGLQTLCDKSYSGQLTIGTEESDRDFGYAELTMYPKRCKRDAIDIGFKKDDDDSRTWMFRRTDDGLSLHHRHVDESGKEDATSGYGGIAATGGSSTRQEFPADVNTGTMIPAAATNVWAIEIVPGKKFAYELQRIEEQRMFRVVFDLTKPL